jgi:hypothetical protein
MLGRRIRGGGGSKRAVFGGESGSLLPLFGSVLGVWMSALKLWRE